jgi:topoisomerase-4 subunit A
LSRGKVPVVMSLRDALREWLDHRKEVLVRRSRFRLREIAKRLEILDGYLIAYLNIDEVIRIIRREDEPKPVLMKRFKLTDIQAEAILNMRLRALRKLEEIEIRTEHESLKKEQTALNKLLKSDDAQWERISGEIKAIKAKYAKNTPLGRRRTDFAAPPEVDFDAEQALVEREPVTVVCSERGWIRAMKGHLETPGELSFKEGDKLKFLVHAETTDKVMLFASTGRFFTLEASRLPGGRGHGEPLRLMADLEVSEHIAALFVHRPERKLLVASTAGDGFIVSEAECVATTRKGKQVLNVRPPAEGIRCVVVDETATHLATIGDNRKLLIFPLKDVPEMTRGKGVRLQKYKEGGLSDARAFNLKEGLSWTDSSGRSFTVTDLKDWIGERAQAGRLPPKGFPKSNRFG